MTATRLTHHESELGSWHTVLRDPPPALAPCVAKYGAWTEDGILHATRLELPTGIVPMQICFETPYSIGAPADAGREPKPFPDFIAGQHDTYAVSRASGKHCGIQVDLTSLGARLFLGLPMHHITNRVLALDEVLGADGRILAEKLRDAPGWDACFDILDETISKRIARSPEIPPGIAWSLHVLQQSPPALRIGSIADELGLSHQALIAAFHDYIGLPPSTIVRIARFNRALALLDTGHERCLVDVALDAGYYDQAHLHRDFRQFTGYGPTEYLRRRMPDNGGLADA